MKKDRIIVSILLIIISIVFFGLGYKQTGSFAYSLMSRGLPSIFLIIFSFLILKKTNISLLELLSFMFPALGMVFYSYFFIIIPFILFISSPIVSLVSFPSIILGMWPIEKYTKNTIRIATVFCSLMFPILIFSIWQLLNLPLSGGGEIGGIDTTSLAAQFGIAASIYSLIFIPLKIRAALKEIKKEGMIS